MANSDACKVPLMRMGIVNRRDEGAPSSPRHSPATVTGERPLFGSVTGPSLRRQATTNPDLRAEWVERVKPTEGV
jgi:hypothetical protein